MEQKILCILFLAGALESQSQLYIAPGAQFYMSGNAEVSLQSAGLFNYGSFSSSAGTVHFTGNEESAISGTQPVDFYRVTINKTGGTAVKLYRNISVSNLVSFTAGFIDLYESNLSLGNSGSLSGETDNARITSTGNGKVVLSRWIDAASANPGNVGVVLNTAGNIGNLLISRGYKVQVSTSGIHNTVKRYYEIGLVNGNSFSGTLRLHYLNAELNGANENTMMIFKQQNGNSWVQQNTSNRSLRDNYLETSGTFSPQFWAMANPGSGNSPAASMLAQNDFTQKLDEAGTRNGNNPKINQAASAFRLWPNPTRGNFFLTLYSETTTSAIISIIDSKGAIIQSQQQWLQQGLNQVTVNATRLPSGTYSVLSVWNNGLDKKTTQLVKH